MKEAICRICGKPIKHNELCAKVELQQQCCWVHLDHHGVRSAIRPHQIMIGLEAGALSKLADCAKETV